MDVYFCLHELLRFSMWDDFLWATYVPKTIEGIWRMLWNKYLRWKNSLHIKIMDFIDGKFFVPLLKKTNIY